MTPCVDCGTPVPTIRTADGDFTLPRCPSASDRDRQTHQDFHRVPRDVADAARAASTPKETR